MSVTDGQNAQKYSISPHLFLLVEPSGNECGHCGGLGHDAAVCPADRWSKMMLICAQCDNRGHEKEDCLLELINQNRFAGVRGYGAELPAPYPAFRQGSGFVAYTRMTPQISLGPQEPIYPSTEQAFTKGDAIVAEKQSKERLAALKASGPPKSTSTKASSSKETDELPDIGPIVDNARDNGYELSVSVFGSGANIRELNITDGELDIKYR